MLCALGFLGIFVGTVWFSILVDAPRPWSKTTNRAFAFSLGGCFSGMFWLYMYLLFARVVVPSELWKNYTHFGLFVGFLLWLGVSTVTHLILTDVVPTFKEWKAHKAPKSPEVYINKANLKSKQKIH